MEKSGLTVNVTIEIRNIIKNLITESCLIERFKEIIERNTYCHFFENFNILWCLVNERVYEYAPLLTVDVGRSFSQLRYILGDLKTNMKVDTLKKSLVIYYNK